MVERLFTMTGSLIYQFLLLLLTALTVTLAAINALLRELQNLLEGQTTRSRIHYEVHHEVHQHLHLEQPTAYQQTVENVSRHIPLPLRQVSHLPLPQVNQVPLRATIPVTPVVTQSALAAYDSHRAA